MMRPGRRVALSSLALLAGLSLGAGSDLPPGAEGWLEARLAGKPAPPIRRLLPDATLADGYRMQALWEQRRVAGGARVAGYKLGFTSPSAQERFGVREPIRGVLLASMAADSGARLDTKGLTRVFVEAEVAFTMGRRVAEASPSPDALRAAVATVHPAIEVAAYRFDREADPGPADFAADGVGAWHFVLGPGRPPSAVDLVAAEVVLERDGQALGHGRGADALGDPWRALQWLAEHLARHGRALEAGDVVLSGALGSVHACSGAACAGGYRVRVAGLGTADVELVSTAGR